MKIVTTELFEDQLKELLEPHISDDFDEVKKFKMYLDTVIINIQTKVHKYKTSAWFDDEDVKEIEFQGYLIPFYIDAVEESYVLLGIVKQVPNLDKGEEE
jgi:hypothetical protein